MLHLTAIKTSQNRSETGFTLIELIAVFMLIAIMSAIAAPGMLGFLSRGKVNSAMSNLQGAFQESQREAIKQSKDCPLIIPTSGSQGNLDIIGSCLISGTRTLKEVTIRHNLASVYTGNDNNLFDFRGATDAFLSDDLIITIFREGNSSGTDATQRCVVVSSGLGLIRAGNYLDSSTTATLDKTKCIPRS